MEIGNIDELGVYTYREFIETDEEGNTYSEIKKVRIDEEEKLVVGETAYFSETRNNKVKRLNEKEYMFYRFDEVQTHIEDYNSDYTIEDFREDVTSKLNYDDLDYSIERVELVNELLDESDGIYDLISSNRIIQKEQKSSKSPLSEGQRLDRQIENIGSYILHPKYSDKEEEEYIEGVRDYYQELRKKKGKTEQDFKEMFDLKDELDLFNHGILTRSREQRNNLRESVESDFEAIESQNVIVDPAEFSKERSVTEYVGRDLEIDEGYWKRMGFSSEQSKFRREVVSVYDGAIGIISKQLGIGQGEQVRKEREEWLRKNLEPINYINDMGKEVNISPSQRVNGIKRMYNELKSDYYAVKEILTTPIEFNQVAPNTTKFDYNNDTWYEGNDGEEVEISKNTILFSNSNTYKGLIANYYNLKNNYYDNFMDDMWYILIVFEELIESTELTNEERFVLDRIMKDYTRREIIEKFEREFGESISGQTIANWVNKTIPNKIRNTHLDSMNKWLYTYKIKGKFKECTKCNKIKTINNDRYFSRNSGMRDGFLNTCKKCR